MTGLTCPTCTVKEKFDFNLLEEFKITRGQHKFPLIGVASYHSVAVIRKLVEPMVLGKPLKRFFFFLNKAFSKLRKGTEAIPPGSHSDIDKLQHLQGSGHSL